MATDPTFVQWAEEALSPPWLQRQWGTAWMDAFAEEKDAVQSWMAWGVQARFASLAPSDALPLISQNRQIEIRVGESEADFRERLQLPFSTWKWSGTDRGVLAALGGTGWTVTFGAGFSPWPLVLPVSGNVWMFAASNWSPEDADVSWASRFWFLCDGNAQGITVPTDDQVDMWKRVIRKWKSAETTCPALYIVTSAGGWADAWGSTGSWGDADEGVWGGSIQTDGGPSSNVWNDGGVWDDTDEGVWAGRTKIDIREAIEV